MIMTPANKTRARSGRVTQTLVLWVVLTFLLALPVWLSLSHLLAPPPRWTVLLGALGLSMVLLGIDGLLRSRVVWLGITLLALGLLWLRGVHFGLVDFSGAGFTREFFIHMEWQSLVIVWEEYRGLLGGVLITLLFTGALLLIMYPSKVRPGAAVSLVVLLGGVLSLGLAHRGLPEADLIRAWQLWNQPVSAFVDQSAVERFAAAGLLNAELVEKQKVQARAPALPKNLILVYLESVGVNLASQPRWPGLMPTLEVLLQEHGWADHLWASSYITIEGLTNSMCGTLFPYVRGSDSMAEGGGLAENLACLGDVVGAAGYQQVYMGGAGMGFAGKGEFLEAHGYNDIRGLEYWASQGLHQRPDTWGVSDPDLFEQSLDALRRLHAENEPFNLTLLTIGTHLPGYRYDECVPYVHSDDRFLQALHCTDQLLGRWIGQLRAQNLLEDTLLVITSDHHVFPSPDMRALFDDAVYDRRLPLIVIGEDVPPPLSAIGAGYDLAPTVLDLLGIEHNASFLLGRSLLQPSARPDYYVTRYPDVQSGQEIENPNMPCDEGPHALPALPLKSCDKEQLLDTLNSMVFALSAAPNPISCNIDIASHIEIPVAAEQPLQFVFNERAESDRFIYQGRKVDPVRPGLFLVVLNEVGQVLTRRFFPPDALDDIQLPDLSIQASSSWLVAAWRPSPVSEERSIMINDDIAMQLGQQAEISLRDHRGKVFEATAPGPSDAISTSLDLQRFFCQSVAIH